eukprot:1178404-Prorocentrum_minimum.AAC.1
MNIRLNRQASKVGGVHQSVLTTHNVADLQSTMVVLRTAMESRQTKAHKMNQRSSRSHMIVYVEVLRRPPRSEKRRRNTKRENKTKKLRRRKNDRALTGRALTGR